MSQVSSCRGKVGGRRDEKEEAVVVVESKEERERAQGLKTSIGIMVSISAGPVVTERTKDNKNKDDQPLPE